jgi:hypothetical protein
MTRKEAKMPAAQPADLGAAIVRNRAPQSVWRALLVMSALNVGAVSASTDSLHKISRADLCVTEGTITGQPASTTFTVDSPKMRAYVNATPVQSIQARFTYLGASSHDVPLGSGTMRRQFGLKLHAQDACNRVYVMWRIEPESKLVVSIKENPGQHSSAECGNRGYRNIKPQRSTPTPKLQPGDSHTLRVETTPIVVKVFIDETFAWQGALSSEVEKWDSRVGIRSDNVRVQFELTGSLNQENADHQNCKSESAEAE